MTLLRDLAAELLSMFLTDARLSAAILALVAVLGVLIDGLAVLPPLAGGIALLFGCLGILALVTALETRRRRGGG